VLLNYGLAAHEEVSNSRQPYRYVAVVTIRAEMAVRRPRTDTVGASRGEIEGDLGGA
jgi:hypothetical protein